MKKDLYGTVVRVRSREPVGMVPEKLSPHHLRVQIVGDLVRMEAVDGLNELPHCGDSQKMGVAVAVAVA